MLGLIPNGKDGFLSVAYREIPYFEIPQYSVSSYTSLRIRRDPPDVCFMLKNEGFLVPVKNEPLAVLFPCRAEIRHSPDPAWSMRYCTRFGVELHDPIPKPKMIDILFISDDLPA